MPRYPNATLSRWSQSEVAADVIRVLSHFQERVMTVMDLVHESDVVTKTRFLLSFTLFIAAELTFASLQRICSSVWS